MGGRKGGPGTSVALKLECRAGRMEVMEMMDIYCAGAWTRT